jgi:heme exporter protein C
MTARPSIQRFANPARFMALSGAVMPWAAGAAALLFTVGLYLALFASPADYQQGETVRIMYVHVPAAWMALFCYTAMAAAHFVGFVWKHPVADIGAKAIALPGAAFTALALITGSLWGQPMWGAWWVWDARLTSVLVLFFLYIGYIALWQAIEDPVKAGKAAGVLALVGVVNIPIIKFSVDWWNTLHQPASVSRFDTPALHISMLTPLLVMAAAYMLFTLALTLLRIRTEIRQRRIRALEMRRARAVDNAGAAAMPATAEARP